MAVVSGGRVRARYKVRKGLPSDVVNALVEDRNGVVWAGTTKGVARLRGNRFEAVTGPRMPTHPMSALAADGLWIGAKGDGLVRYAEGSVQRYTTKERLASPAHSNRIGSLFRLFVQSANAVARSALSCGSRAVPVTAGLRFSEVLLTEGA